MNQQAAKPDAHLRTLWVWWTIYLGFSLVFLSLFYHAWPGLAEKSMWFVQWGIALFAVVFVQLFTATIPAGKDDPRRIRLIRYWFTFAYAFMTISLAAAILLVNILAVNQKGSVERPVSLLIGCSEDKNAPPELKCRIIDDENGDGKYFHQQWLVNVGGIAQACPDSNESYCVKGGVQIPLYLLVFALVGGAISLTRRIPEYQRRSAPAFVATAKATRLDPEEAREYVVFQILQYLSAPFLALVAYYLVTPDSKVVSITVAFASGFASESILLMVRALLEKITPVSVAKEETGALAGVIVDVTTHRGVPDQEVRITGRTTEIVKTDQHGHYVLHSLPAGPYTVEVKTPAAGETVQVEVEEGKMTVCNVDL